jgi:hypothetical protein
MQRLVFQLVITSITSMYGAIRSKDNEQLDRPSDNVNVIILQFQK